MSASSSSTSRELRQQEIQEKEYEALVEQVRSQAPTSDCENFVCAGILLVIHIIFKNTLSHLSLFLLVWPRSRDTGRSEVVQWSEVVPRDQQ